MSVIKLQIFSSSQLLCDKSFPKKYVALDGIWTSVLEVSLAYVIGNYRDIHPENHPYQIRLSDEETHEIKCSEIRMPSRKTINIILGISQPNDSSDSEACSVFGSQEDLYQYSSSEPHTPGK